MVKDRFSKQLWISVGVIVVSIGIATGVLIYLSGGILAQADLIVTDRQTIQAKTDAVANLAQLEAAVPQATQYQTAFAQLIPDQYGVVTFPQWLAGLGVKYNVSASAALLGTSNAAGPGIAGTTQFSFTAEGLPKDLTTFLNVMNTNATGFLLSITSFDVVSDGSSEKITGQGILFSQ